MRILVLVWLMLMSALAVADDNAHDQGGCDKYPWDMNREWSLMVTDPIPFKSATAIDPEAHETPKDRRMHYALHPVDQVKLGVPSDKAESGKTYAGMSPLHVPFSTRFRVSSSKPVWIDVVGPNGALPAAKFAMRLGCERLVKTVVFKLDIDTDYWLQITGSKDPMVELLITMDR